MNERHIQELLEARAQLRPGATALEAPGLPPLTYAALAAHVRAIVRTLREAGIGEQDRVAYVLPDGPAAAVAFLSVSSAATAAPLNPAYGRPELEFYLGDLNARAVIVPEGGSLEARAVAQERGIAVLELVPSAAAAGMFELRGGGGAPAAAAGSAGTAGAQAEARPVPATAGSRSPDATALVLHTSGTTARPKIVPLTHANLCLSAANTTAALALSPDDRCLNVMPLFHVHGLIGALLSSLTAGASVICTPGFQAPRFLDWLAEQAPSWYTAVPTMHQAIVDRATTRGPIPVRSSLRVIRSCSAALPPSLMANLERTFAVPVIEAYGMTEASHQIASNPLPPAVRKPGSIGLPAGPEVAVLGPDGGVLGADATGEVAIRGPNVTLGYENNPQANAATFTDGWFRTGDQGYRDADGYIFLTGRIKELINCGGEKVSPREIDEVLLAHEAVAQAVAFSVPDARLGEAVAAAVVLRPGAQLDENQLRQFAATRMTFFKVPRQVVFVNELPKGPTGKLQRIGLADRLGLKPHPVKREPAPVVDDAARRIASIAAEILDWPDLDATDNFLEAGGDSVTGAMLVSRLRETLGADVTLLDLFDAHSLAALSKVIANRRPAGPVSATAAALPPAIESYHLDGALPPFHFFHAATEGDASYCRSLAEALGADRPVHGFAPLGLDGTRVPETVEDIARECVRRIRERQPTGPYRLAGYCISGPAVFEAARQLREAGETVAFLGMIESEFRPLGPQARVVAGVLDALHPVVSRRQRAQVLRAARTLAGQRLPPLRGSSPDSIRVRSSYHRAIAAYAPKPLDVPLVYFRARECETNAYWQRLGSRYTEIVVPGDHNSCVMVHSAAMAGALSPWLADSPQRLRGDNGAPRSTS
ncbi:MAG: AMP-binding protein [Candidatus Eisenbacteria bacterium]